MIGKITRIERRIKNEDEDKNSGALGNNVRCDYNNDSLNHLSHNEDSIDVLNIKAIENKLLNSYINSYQSSNGKKHNPRTNKKGYSR